MLNAPQKFYLFPETIIWFTVVSIAQVDRSFSPIEHKECSTDTVKLPFLKFGERYQLCYLEPYFGWEGGNIGRMGCILKQPV
jgi:hypothetical protein